MALRQSFLTPKTMKNKVKTPLKHSCTTSITPSKIPLKLRTQNSSNNQVLKKSPGGLIQNSELNNYFNLNQIFNDFDNEDVQIDKENFYILGSGSFGVVIRASYKEKPASIKVSKNVHKVFGEFNMLKMNHKNLVKVLYYTTNHSYSITIMEEYSKCTNLEFYLKSNFIDLETKTKFAIDISSGLNYCHFMNILHLDIKASNVLVTKENVCKLCDFGSSIKLENMADHLTYTTTISHTAPEILLGQKPTVKSDIYSLAITFWEIQYCCTPYDGIENDVIVYNVVKNDWRPKVFEDVTNTLLPFKKCWAKDPEQRLNTSEILQDLLIRNKC